MSLKSDRLRGAQRIADFRGDDLRRTYYLLERKIIPAFKEGRIWVASKQALCDQHEHLAAGIWGASKKALSDQCEHQAAGPPLAGTDDDAPE